MTRGATAFQTTPASSPSTALPASVMSAAIATLLRRGAGMESVKQLLGHASITTTIDTYGHLTVEDARATLQDAGWFTGQEVRW